MAFVLADQLKKLQQRKELLIILLFLFVIIIFWVAIEIFSSQQRSGISGEQRRLAQPLSPNLETSVIDTLEEKRIYSAEELADFPIFIVENDQGQTVTTNPDATSSSSVVLPGDLENILEEIEEGL